ncbi:MAG: hypothetical protein GTN40_00435 [Candidatus Aenigmarchaeota archaeon]|nr:hypothetical protein [Candidatus Aenigmarchaeota archaeon]NIO44429.1 hypothetical protein [Candidatus Aenigmarchaeota archaeon]
MSAILKEYGISLSKEEGKIVDDLHERLMKMPGYKNSITHAFIAYVLSPLVSLKLPEINPLMKKEKVLDLHENASKELISRLEKVSERCDGIKKVFEK